MAKRRLNIGNVYKSKDPSKADYIQINKALKEAIVLQPGQYISVESKAYQKASLERAVADGKLSEENAEKARARIEKIPDFVRGELILLSE
jgi:hypothetical protein